MSTVDRAVGSLHDEHIQTHWAKLDAAQLLISNCAPLELSNHKQEYATCASGDSGRFDHGTRHCFSPTIWGPLRITKYTNIKSLDSPERVV